MTLSAEDRFGIKTQPKRGMSIEQKYSALAGTVYVLGGIIGFFITGWGSFTEMTGRELFGVFMLNPFHNIVHIGLGAFWLLAAFALTQAGTEGVNIAIGGVYALATVLGILGYFSLLSIPGGIAVGDNWLHLVTAVVTLIFGSGILSAMGGGRQSATA
jgi:Domain of unknown function (DUF4383)